VTAVGAGLHPAVRELASALGVATEFWDWQGQQVQVPPSTVEAVLAALGLDASTPQAAASALSEHRLARWRRRMPPCTVVRAGEPARVWVHVPHGSSVRPYVRLEDGGVRADLVQLDQWVPPTEVDGELVGEATFALPEDLPLGWHTLVVDDATAPLVVTPTRLDPLPTTDRVWGFLTQLYSVR